MQYFDIFIFIFYRVEKKSALHYHWLSCSYVVYVQKNTPRKQSSKQFIVKLENY